MEMFVFSGAPVGMVGTCPHQVLAATLAIYQSQILAVSL